jgi:hypothetical protein
MAMRTHTPGNLELTDFREPLSFAIAGAWPRRPYGGGQEQPAELGDVYVTGIRVGIGTRSKPSANRQHRRGGFV